MTKILELNLAQKNFSRTVISLSGPKNLIALVTMPVTLICVTITNNIIVLNAMFCVVSYDFLLDAESCLRLFS